MLRNLTPHEVVVLVGDDECIIAPDPAGPARAAEVETDAGWVFVRSGDVGPSVEVTERSFGDVTGLPAPEEGVWLIVSSVVAAAAPARRDLLTPAGLVRSDTGAVIGCTHFARPAAP